MDLISFAFICFQNNIHALFNASGVLDSKFSTSSFLKGNGFYLSDLHSKSARTPVRNYLHGGISEMSL